MKLTPKKRSWRFERKYRIPLDLRLAQQILKLHPADFSMRFPDRIVNNIYFDTSYLSTFNENLAGVGIRKKYRLRWYGSPVKIPGKAFFEIKMKQNELGAKRTFPVKFKNWSQISTLPELLPEGFKAAAPIAPVLLNSYRRAYYESSDGKFRLTLDSDLHFGRMSFDYPTLSYPASSHLVLELKYKRKFDDEAHELMQLFPFRQTKNSKFAEGIKWVYGLNS